MLAYKVPLPPTEIQNWTPPPPCHSAIGSCDAILWGLIQPSIVKPPEAPTLRLELAGTEIYPLDPSSEKACPTSPGANPTPPTIKPLLVPTISLASPSAGHQEIKPACTGAHGGAGLTVSTALELR